MSKKLQITTQDSLSHVFELEQVNADTFTLKTKDSITELCKT